MHSKKLISTLLTAALSLALSGCLAQSQIQAKYMQKEADCREEAQMRVANGQQTGLNTLGYDSQVESAYTLASGFSECMNKGGWKVASPKGPPAQTASNVPPPVGAPGPGGVVAARAVNNNQTTVAPPANLPPPANNIGVQGTNAAPPYASTRPYGTYMPEYGTGAGRQF